MHAMESQNLIAESSILIDAKPDQVWNALVDPALIQKYMFGTQVTSDWKKGSKIVWAGEWKGKKYEDRGEVLLADPPRELQYTHFSPLSGLEDTPEHYHTVTIRLSGVNDQTRVMLSQDKNPTDESQKESQRNWESMLQSLKKVVEAG